MEELTLVHINGGQYYLQYRAKETRSLFTEDKDYETFTAMLEAHSNKTQTVIYGYCMLRDALHLLIKLPPNENQAQDNLKAMLREYNKWFNQTHELMGQIFDYNEDESGNELFIDNDMHLVHTLRHIHLIPVEHHDVADMNIYRWSSHHAYIQPYMYPWISSELIYELLHTHRSGRIRQYDQFMHQKNRTEASWNFNTGNTKQHLAFANQQDLDKLLGVAKEEQSLPVITVDSVVSMVCKTYGVTQTALRTQRRLRMATEVRGTIAWLSQEATLTSMKDLANHLNTSEMELDRSLRSIAHKSPIQLYEMKQKLYHNAQTH